MRSYMGSIVRTERAYGQARPHLATGLHVAVDLVDASGFERVYTREIWATQQDSNHYLIHIRGSNDGSVWGANSGKCYAIALTIFAEAARLESLRRARDTIRGNKTPGFENRKSNAGRPPATLATGHTEPNFAGCYYAI